MATVTLRPVLTEDEDGRLRPGDEWTRLGSVCVVVPGERAGSTVVAQSIFLETEITADTPSLRHSITIPAGLARPRLRIISTGHASDGRGGDEFVTRTHLLRIDGVEIARWRPWADAGGTLRSGNPTSHREQIDGRWLWSSDVDRSGWHPGTTVEPLIVPVPELTPGRHTIELAILGIRPRGPDGARGYWRTSVVVVADEPWPAQNPP